MKTIIFSGFLGAGKTTLIKKLISESFKGQKLVLIENEFGEIGVDSGFLKDAGIQINEINSGCICCSLVGDFTKALNQVIDTYNPEVLFIEPSGVGKLSDVLKAVEQVVVGDIFSVTVVDAKKCKMYSKNFGEFFSNQIMFADTIVLSHTQLATIEQIKSAEEIIRGLNGSAMLVSTDWDNISGDKIVEAIYNKNNVEQLIDALIKETKEHKHHHEHEHHHEHGEECCCGHHEHEHHHEHEEGCCCGHHEHEHHHEHEEGCCGRHEHEHHHEHGEDCCCGRHEYEHHHEHGEGCTCGCHDHDHHADEVFTSFGVETANRYTIEQIESILSSFDEMSVGLVLRAKGIVESVSGEWIHFDYVPGEVNVRIGSSDVIGKICVIGSQINNSKIEELFKL